MIRVHFAEPGDDRWREWLDRATRAQATHAEGAEVNDAIVRGVRDWLLDATFGKCVYCERAISGHRVRVDHFRPKRGIRRMDGKRVPLRAEAREHPGYHWLVYAWRNLLPSCETCNLAKSNHFHTRNGWWAEHAGELAQEQPLLVNPWEEDPEGLLLFRDDGLVLPAVSGDPRARYVIDTLDLNREELREARAEAWLEAGTEVKAAMVLLAEDGALFERSARKVEAVRSGRAEFSALKRLAIEAERREAMEQIDELRRRGERLAAGLTPQPRPPV